MKKGWVFYKSSGEHRGWNESGIVNTNSLTHLFREIGQNTLDNRVKDNKAKLVIETTEVDSKIFDLNQDYLRAFEASKDEDVDEKVSTNIENAIKLSNKASLSSSVIGDSISIYLN